MMFYCVRSHDSDTHLETRHSIRFLERVRKGLKGRGRIVLGIIRDGALYDSKFRAKLHDRCD
jgi:hypothetical protein